MAAVRLQKVLARAGIASRRAAEQLISAGRVRVDGHVVTQLGTKVDPRKDRVEVDGQRVVRERLVYVVLHKPRGVVSTMRDPQGRPSVRELLAEVAGRAYPVGRLDFNTSGVLLATNDGEFADALLHPSRDVPKTYVVKVQGVMEPADLDKWRRGVALEDGMTRPAKVRLLRHEDEKTWLEITISEGRTRQVRRMGDATGFRVMRLTRTSFAGVGSEGLPPGVWRYLSPDELRTIKKQFGVPKRIASPPQDAVRPPGRRAGVATGEPRQGTHPGPRYGGGAPARRSVATRRDWDGGVRRGSSGAFDEDAEGAPPRADVGSRGQATRTTGTAGGIGGGNGAYRLNRQRRARRPPRRG